MINTPTLFVQRSPRSGGAKNIVAILLLLLVLLLPNRLGEITPTAFACLPLEALILAFSLMLPGGLGALFRWLAASALVAGVVVKLADLAVDQAFGRAFNPLLDSRFPADGMHLLQGALGRFGGGLAVGLLGLMLLGLFMLIYRALARLQVLLGSTQRASAIGLSVAASIWLGLSAAASPVAATPFVDWLAKHWQAARDSQAALLGFEQIVDVDRYAALPDQVLFSKLRGKDVLLVFVESYGRTVLDMPEYAASIRPILEQGGAALAASGVSVRSAFLTSPTYGGISWLAHGSLMSGLWIDSQSRYDRLLMSQRASLNRLFQRAGWRTLAVQPAHTMPWPQGDYFGYDRIYAASDLAYRGQPFNWITMPDQYTLAALQRLERGSGPRQPIMAEIALISSHAPWTPLPHLLNWDQVGDGSVFNRSRDGDAPEVVWKSPQRIREQYRKSIAYVLSTVISYVRHYADDNLVILLLGDHQPAPFVSGDAPSRDVPVHLISRDSRVIDAISEWQWTPGLIPSVEAPVWGMDVMKGRLIEAFSQSDR